MDKFKRNYVLEVQTQTGNTLFVTLPFTMEFDIIRNSYSSANISSIRVYNLSAKNRNLIRKDRTDYGALRTIKLRAGYGTNLPVIFVGNVTQAWSVREGVDFITQIESFDGGFAYANAITNEQFIAGTPLSSIIDTFIETLPGVSKGAVGDYPGAIGRGNSYSGSTTSLLDEITGGGFFIDNERAYCLGDNECIQGAIQVINSASGLLGTPVREEIYLNFDILFEPRLSVAQKIQLDSITGANFNSAYKVVSLKHRGTISDAVCGDAVTSVGVFAPGELHTVAIGV